MSAARGAISRWMFPDVELLETPAGLRVRIAGLRRFGLATSVCGFALLVVVFALRDQGLAHLYLPIAAVCSALLFAYLAAVSPPLEIETDRRDRAIRTTRDYLWMFRHEKLRAIQDVRVASVEAAAVKDKRGQPTGAFTYHPVLNLRDGSIEKIAPTWSFSHADAGRIAGAVNAMLPRAHAEAAPLAGVASRDGTKLDQMDAAAIDRRERHYCRAMGVFFVCAGLLVLWIMRGLLVLPTEAEIVGSAPMCQYTWSRSERDSETQASDCSFVPTPARLPKDLRPKVYRGLELSVRFLDRAGSEVRGRVFVTNPKAERARDGGRVRVSYRPGERFPVREWPGYGMLIAAALIPLSGFAFFFLADARQWLRRRGLTWR